MKIHVWFACLTLASALAACSLQTDAPLTPTPTPAPTLTPSPSAPPPRSTETPSPTPRPQAAFAIAKEQPVNCRYGPGTVYAVVGGLQPEQFTQIAGRNEAGTWWYVNDPGNPGGFCWVAAAAVNTEGGTDSLPEMDAPPITATKLAVRVEPQRVTVACNNFPQFVNFAGEITTNGPTLVTWHWEINTGAATQDQTLIFEQAGTKSVHGSFTIDSANDYWVKLVVTTPNEIGEMANFYANCTP